MRIIKKPKDIGIFLHTLRRRASGGDPAIGRVVNSILSDVKKNGDTAVLRYTRKFDYAYAKSLLFKRSEISKFADKADRKIVRALEISAKRIRRFHEMQKEESWMVRDSEYRKLPVNKNTNPAFSHSLLGQLIRPIERVGVYVPGGKASYPSTALMNIIPAQVAGVKQIAVCVPTPHGEINPYVMAAIEMLGIKEAYRIGGAQAIGAMAYGTQALKKVDKIVGPGNIYVATAKRMVFGEVDIDMIAGPSEVLIIADGFENPAFIAADLLSQAEHDELASPVLITDSEVLAEYVIEEIERQVLKLKRKAIAKKSLKNYGVVIVARDIAHAVRLSNDIAPEHLEIMTENPVALVPAIKNAGAIFLGRWTPESLGDYAAGPNHTLPTGGTARFSSPLGVYDFIKRSSLLSFTEGGFLKIAKTVETIADIEGLEAHGNTIRIRTGRKS